MEIRIRDEILAYCAGLSSLIAIVLTMPRDFFILVYSFPLTVRLGVSVIYSVLTFVLIYLILRTEED